MEKSFYAGFELHERAEVRHRGDAPFDDGPQGVLGGDIRPGMRLKLL